MYNQYSLVELRDLKKKIIRGYPLHLRNYRSPNNTIQEFLTLTNKNLIQLNFKEILIFLIQIRFKLSTKDHNFQQFTRLEKHNSQIKIY